MLNRRGAAVRAAIVAIVMSLVSAGGCATVSRPAPDGQYCAVMDDSIGLYVGNSVTRKGVPVGAVAGIERGLMSITVRFNLEDGTLIPADVTAVTRTPTILADRSLELHGGDRTRGVLLPNACISLARTATAKSISEGLASINTVFSHTMDAGRGDTLKRLVLEMSTQLDGNGPGIREALSSFAAGVRDPVATLTTADQLITDASELMTTTTENWAAIETVLQHVVTVVTELDSVFKGLGPLLGSIGPLLQAFLDVATHLRGIVWSSLDTAAATVRLLSDHTGVIVMNAGTLPNILDGVRSFWARIHANPPRMIPVLSPRVAAGPQDNGQICSRTDMDNKDHCGLFYGVPDGITSVDLLQLVLNGGVPR
ncbi:MlaD family protein [Mycobacteroides abscessus]|uniref:MlaD family protein n=1 Tax=Mycobacteroides abscessus TaxID=36809 RepID=UPI0009A63752|nr:MlaD family protein [Mycobacteroides abscessus]SLG56306.1 Mce family protein [Mycobacteroides abscessus subsp. abscessus]